MECRLCQSDRLLCVLDLGATPRSERLLTTEQLDQPEITHSLRLQLCQDCLLLQIPALITPEATYSEYTYYASYSDDRVQQAKDLVSEAVKRLGLGPDSLVIEVASNDGYLLQHVVAAGVPCLGIEPSLNVAAAARDRNVPTVSAFLDEQFATETRRSHGPADLVIANNVYAQISDLRGFTRSLRMLLDDDGWLAIEVHHALNLVQHGHFDSVCPERFQYYTLFTAICALATAGMAVVDVEYLATQGGQLRIWARSAEIAGEPTERVDKFLRAEEAAGLHSVDGYLSLQSRAEAARQALLRFLLECRAEGKRVVGYGAPGEGNTLLNYCGVRTDLVEYTVARNPYMHGHFTPGARIPIHAPERIAEDRPDVVLALTSNLENETTDRLGYIEGWGAALVFPFPNLHQTTGLTAQRWRGTTR